MIIKADDNVYSQVHTSWSDVTTHQPIRLQMLSTNVSNALAHKLSFKNITIHRSYADL